MLSLQEIYEKMGQLKQWSLDGESLVCVKEFKNFKEALIFVNNVAEIAERQDHYPSIVVDYNIVQLRLTTPAAHAVTEKDFVVAGEIERL